MPLKSGCVSKMALHCSFEHFEQDVDIRFIKEANRIPGKGGKLCIIPLYLFNKYANQTDPAILFNTNLNFEQDAGYMLRKVMEISMKCFMMLLISQIE